MTARRLLVVIIVLGASVVLGSLLAGALASGGWTIAKALMLGSFLLVCPWIGLCLATGVIGFAAIIARDGLGDTPALLADGAGDLPPTAIAVTVRNEDMRTVLAPIRTLLDALDAVGAGDRFALFVLSDTSDPSAAVAEAQAVGAFRAADRDPARVHYRRRPRNEGFKAGNVMDFLDHHAAGFELMLVLDADSQMSGAAVLRLVRIMRDNPGLAVAQHLTVGLPASSAFPRLFQYGMRAGMRVWATALTWWQGDESCYWGHNAVLRIAPFRQHCRLPLLPGGRHILSHDQIEAAMLAGAGWGVRLIPLEDGSAEANPPAMPEFIRRDTRWLAGNLEYWHLLAMPGLRPMGRWQLIQAILMFGCAPFQLLFLLAAAWVVATDSMSGFPAGPVAAVSLAWLGGIYATKLLGYLEILATPDKRVSYGGAGRIAAGAMSEIVFALLMDPISAVSKTMMMLRLAIGKREHWSPQNRGVRGVSWSEAMRLLWPHTLLGLVLLACFAKAGPLGLLWAAVFVGGLVVAVPFCVLTAHPRMGAWLQRHGVAALPEELDEPDRRRIQRLVSKPG